MILNRCFFLLCNLCLNGDNKINDNNARMNTLNYQIAHWFSMLCDLDVF